MKFTVIWLPDVIDELAILWLNPSIRKAVTNAADRIDMLLSGRPTEVGESRPNDRRILFESPLGITYRIKQADMKVYVLRIWCFRKRSNEAE
jgi:hypothetical protein